MTQATSQRKITFIQAINEALSLEMKRDPNIIVMGEDIAGGGDRPDKQDAWGGPMRLTKGLIGQFGPQRVRDTPISEAGFVGSGVGAAASGLRPVIDLMYVGFYGVCADQITNNAAKMHYMFGGKVNIPLTIMTGIGAGTNSAAQHSETLYSIFTHFPGLKCVCPSNPYNAKGLMIAAIRDNNPVVFIEHRMLYSLKEHVPNEAYEGEIGKARRLHEGSDITIVAISHMVIESLRAHKLLEKIGVSAEIIDPIWLSPLDIDSIIASVEKTGRLLVVDNAWLTCGASAEICLQVVERLQLIKKIHVERIGYENTPCPTTKPLENMFYPNPSVIASKVHNMIYPNKKTWSPSIAESEEVANFRGPF